MSNTLRRGAAAAAAAVAATALVVPLTAAPAAAVGATEMQYFLADSDGDFNYGLWKRTTPSGAATKVLETASLDISDLSISQDGTRMVYLQTTLDYYGDPVRDQVVVRDIGGQGARVVSDVLESNTAWNGFPAISPDGNTVVWLTGGVGGAPTLVKAGAGSGATTVIKAGYFIPVFLNPSTLLVRDFMHGGAATLPLAGGTTQATTLPAAASDFAVSPDGTKLAWSLDTTQAQSETADVQVATFSVTSGAATVDAPTTFATGLFNGTPAFSRDGLTVYYVKYDGDFGPGDVWYSDGATATQTPTATSDEFDVAIGSVDSVGPDAAVTLPATLNGTSATLRWQPVTTPDASYVIVQRKLGATVQKTVNVPTSLTSYLDTGLAQGSTYTYSFTVVDRSGNVGPAVTRSLTALKPGAIFGDPTSRYSTKASFPVRFATAAPSNVTYTVDYLPAGTTTWKHWVTGVTGLARTFGAAASTGVLATPSIPGQSYTFRVLAQDAYGNATAATSSARAVVPFDQTKATLYGGSNVYSTAAYLGSYRRLSKTGDYARVTLSGNRLQIVGWKCSACGAFGLYDGSTLIATVDTHASSTLGRTVLYTRTYSSIGPHTFTLRPKATAGRPYVMVDGFAMRR